MNAAEKPKYYAKYRKYPMTAVWFDTLKGDDRKPCGGFEQIGLGRINEVETNLTRYMTAHEAFKPGDACVNLLGAILRRAAIDAYQGNLWRHLSPDTPPNGGTPLCLRDGNPKDFFTGPGCRDFCDFYGLDDENVRDMLKLAGFPIEDENRVKQAEKLFYRDGAWIAE